MCASGSIVTHRAYTARLRGPGELERYASTAEPPGLPKLRQSRILRAMRTVAETPVFIKYASEVWSEVERVGFINWIAANADAGDLIAGSGGCRKVRWSTSGTGKRGGARVIYFLEHEHTIWLLIVYKKAKFDNLPTEFISELRKGVEDAL